MLKRLHFSTLFAIPTLIAAAGIALLVAGTAMARPLWVDEQMLLLNVRDRSITGLAGALWLDQSAPFGWLVLERTLLLALGSGERAVRLLTTLFGSATLVTALWIGRRWMTPAGAGVLTALCATGQWLVFFTLELKHYSSDALWGLLLPAVALWAIDAREDPRLLARRTFQWWCLAAAGQWFANGAVFVAPATGAMLLAVCWHRGGVRGLRPAAAGVAVWLASFGVNFVVTLRPALQNEYLRNYWAFAFPPVSDGAFATARWLLMQLEPVAVKPLGSRLWLLFWIAWAFGIGFALVTRRAVGWAYAAVPASAVALALAGIVPPFERLVVWFVPSVYVGVALCADAAVALARARGSGRAWALATAAAAAAIVTVVTADVAYYGVRAFAYRPRSNYGLDDRSSVRYLLSGHRPGDPVLTTHYGAAAIWWYGGVDVSAPDAGARLADGSPLFEITHTKDGDCRRSSDALTRVLAGRSRADVYLGFRLNVEPPDFGDRVLAELAKRGRMVGYKEYGEESRIASFDLTQATAHAPDSDGCVSIAPAARW